MQMRRPLVTKYAAKTDVSTERSRGEIERILVRYGATSFAYGWEGTTTILGFKMQDRHIRYKLAMPAIGEFRYTENRRLPRSQQAMQDAWEQACRQRWRALALIIKAKLEAIESGITDFETEFLAHTLLPEGRTVGEWIQPQIVTAYETGRMPQLLPGLPAPKEEA
jgi:hypothetical protein